MTSRNQSTAMALLVTLASLAGGCTVVSDVNDYRQPELCDLEMQLRGFDVHREEMFEARAVTTEDELSARFIMQDMGAANIDFRMPRAIDGRPHRVDFFADANDDGDYDPPGAMGDHTWQVDDPCTNPPVLFEHKLDFAPLPTPMPRGDDFHMELTELREGVPFELRVVEISPEVEAPGQGEIERIGRTVGLFYSPAVELNDEGRLIIDLPGIIRADRKYLIAFWSDGNDGTGGSEPNGSYDPPPADEAWRLTFEGESATNVTFARLDEYFDIGGLLVTPNP